MSGSEGNLDDVALSTAHAEGAAAEMEFRLSFHDLVELLNSADALDVISRLSADLLTRPPEKPDDVGVTMAHLYQIEQLQALALTRPRGPSAMTAEEAAQAKDAALLALSRNAKASLGRPKIKYTQDRRNNDRQELLALIQRWTFSVRGVRHPYQTLDYASEVAAAVDTSFRGYFDCSALEVVAALGEAMIKLDLSFKSWLSSAKGWEGKKTGIGMIDAFVREMSVDQAKLIRNRTLPLRYDRYAVRSMLRHLHGAELVERFTLDVEELARTIPPDHWPAVKKVLLSLSCEFGSLEQSVLEHLQLDNPIRTKPFIRLQDGRLFCGSAQSLIVGLAEIMESLYAQHPGLKQTAEKARADWLEDRLEIVVRKFLPSADVYRSVKSHESEEAENDVVAVIDQTVLVFEAKSAKILPAARRGALNSLKGTLGDLVVEPSAQSAGFAMRVRSATAPIEFDAAGGRKLVIDPAMVRDIIRVNILQDVVGPLSSHWPQLKEVGLIPAEADVAPTMSIFELESIFDVLTLEVERCHYLSRRAEVERNCIYTADEFDLLALYVENQFNIGSDEFDGEHHQFYGLSLNITPKLARRGTESAPLVRVKRTELWQRLLQSLESKNRLDGRGSGIAF